MLGVIVNVIADFLPAILFAPLFHYVTTLLKTYFVG